MLSNLLIAPASHASTFCSPEQEKGESEQTHVCEMKTGHAVTAIMIVDATGFLMHGILCFPLFAFLFLVSPFSPLSRGITHSLVLSIDSSHSRGMR
jgi:hypothetical protein